jgi:hypothetical protein
VLCSYVWMDIFAVRQWPGNGADLGFESVVRDTNALLLCAVHLPAVGAISPLKIATATAQIPPEVLQWTAWGSCSDYHRYRSLLQIVRDLRTVTGKSTCSLKGLISCGHHYLVAS